MLIILTFNSLYYNQVKRTGREAKEVFGESLLYSLGHEAGGLGRKGHGPTAANRCTSQQNLGGRYLGYFSAGLTAAVGLPVGRTRLNLLV